MDDYFIILFIIMAVAAIAEVVLSEYWAPFYFRTGIPIFLKKIRVPDRYSLELNINDLNEKFKSAVGLSIVFHKIGNNEYAFREKIFEFTFFSYIPIMHGHILLDFRTGILSTTGRTNWFPLVFILIFTGFVIESISAANRPIEIFVILLVLLIILYLIQYFRYRKISDFVSHIHIKKERTNFRTR